MISIVIPVYNEESSIADTIDKIKLNLLNTKIVHEIIVVDDGSNDNTKNILHNTEDIVLICRDVNKGYGFSLKEGILKSKGDKNIR